MDKNDSPSGNLWLPYVLVLVLMAAGIAVGPPGRSPLRPQITNTGREDIIPESQNIPARLWQDPFEATSITREATQGIDRGKVASHTFISLSDLVRKHTTKDPVFRQDGTIDYLAHSHRVLFHFVSLPSDAYPEAGEQRIRTRVAVISALSTAGYRPANASRLGIATWDASDAGPIVTSQKAYPFEVFEYEPARNFMVPKQERLGRRFDEVVVIYVEDGSIQARHQLEWLKRLSRLLADAMPPERLRKQWMAADWLGPISSDRVIALLRTAASQSAEDNPDLHPDPGAAMPITILAVRPTIEPSFVSRIMRPEVESTARIPQRVVKLMPDSRAKLARALWATPRHIPLAFRSEEPADRAPWLAFAYPPYIPLRHSGNTLWSPWLTLERIGCDDALLAQALARELTLRRPRLFGQEPVGSIALVSEWDTLYGRALPQSFEEAFIRAGGKAAQLHRFTYLRGLDGQTTGALENPKSEKATPESPDLFQELLKSRAPSIAFGRTQVDYVDRLAAQLQTLQRTRPEERLEAVGILGSDTYDKLLILQGLRKVFPSVQYFTTELDASLFAPEHYKVTRNLLIATGFDLHLYEEYQESILPFRDSSQASLYFGTLRALQYFTIRKNQGTVRAVLESWKPAVVEIGRNGPYLLDPGSYVESPQSDAIKPPRSPLPDPHQSVRAWWRRFLFPLAALVIVLASTLTQVGQLTVERAAKTLSLIWQEHIRLIRWQSVCQALGRPRLQVTKDIAMWSVIAGGIFFIGVATAIPWIAERIGEEPLYITEGISSWPATWLRALGVFLCACYFWIIVRQFRLALDEGTELLRIEPEGCPPKECPDRPTPCEAWDRFSARSRGRKLKIVILVSWLIYCGVAVVFIPLDPPAGVTRGPLSISWEKTVLFMAVFSMHLLITYSVAHNVSCAFFIREVARWLRSPDDSEFQERALHTTLMRAIGHAAGVMTRMIYYPFILLFLLIAARHGLFDNFDWPVSLIVVFSISSGALLISALLLRRSADKARKNAVLWLEERSDHFQWQLAGVSESKQPEEARRALGRVNWQLSQIQGIRGAALSEGFFSNPLLRAVLIPVGGTGLLQLMDVAGKLF